MISTVTPATTTMIAAAGQNPAYGDALALVAVLALLVFLVCRDVVDGWGTPQAQRVNQALMIGLLPLGCVFVALWLASLARVLATP